MQSESPKYPFLSASKGSVGAELKEDEIERAAAFLMDALRGKAHVPSSKVYALSRLLLHALDDGWAYGKFSDAMAKTVEDKDTEAVALDFFPSYSHGKIPLPEYLKGGGSLSGASLDKGFVSVDAGELRSLVRNAVRKKILDFRSARRDLIPKRVLEIAEEMRKKLPKPSHVTARGKNLELPCVQVLLKGEPEGSRYYGAMALAIACVRDGVSKDAAMEVMEEYANRCAHGTHPFSSREARDVAEWVYRHPNVRFSCRRMQDNNLAPTELCDRCRWKPR
ncbi:Uncharacterised protein [Candidatus Norongarragalina meridionalis]|nr:Uncharacterised protein [Candidatus Norongarragalina meridionalis]